MKKLLLVAAMGVFMQPAFAEVQVAGKVGAVLGGKLSTAFPISPGLSATEQAFIMDTSDPNFTDWNDPGQEFATVCAAYPIGNIVIIDTATDTGKLGMSMLVSAKLTGQTALVIYHAESNAAFQSGFKCVADVVGIM